MTHNTEATYRGVSLRGTVVYESRHEVYVDDGAEALDELANEDGGAWVPLDKHPDANRTWVLMAEDALMERFMEDRESAAIDEAYDRRRDEALFDNRRTA